MSSTIASMYLAREGGLSLTWGDLDERVRGASAALVGLSYERIRKFAMSSTELSVEAGEVTPSLKVRRRAVEERHRTVLEGLYDDELRSREEVGRRGVRPRMVSAI
jgi:hypothetical protein